MYFANDQTAVYLPPSNGRRCNSAPPYSVRDIGQDYDYPVGVNREFADKPLWHVDFPLDGYRDVTETRMHPKFPQARVLILDSKLVLKMMSPLIDISAIASAMRLAATVVPVPQVYDFGFSGNCSYIIMEYVSGFNLGEIMVQFPTLSGYIVAPQINTVIQRLASVGLSHNDLEPRNILIDSSWRIVSVIDWDLVSSYFRSTDYARRTLDTTSPSWSYFFLRNAGQRGYSLALNPVDGHCLMKDVIPPPAPRRALTQALTDKESSLPYVRCDALIPSLKSSEPYVRIAIITSHACEFRLLPHDSPSADHTLAHIISAVLDAIEGSEILASVCAVTAVVSEEELSPSICARLPSGTAIRAGHPLGHEIDTRCAFSSIAYTLPHIVLMSPDCPSKFDHYARAITEAPVKLVSPPFHPIVFRLRTSYTPRHTPRSTAPDDQWIAHIRCTAFQLWLHAEKEGSSRGIHILQEAPITKVNSFTMALEQDLAKAVVTSMINYLKVRHSSLIRNTLTD